MKHYIEMPDDGLVNFRGQLVTAEQTQALARRIMAGFDEMSPRERYSWNYAHVQPGFNPSTSPLRYAQQSQRKSQRQQRAMAKRIAAAGDSALLGRTRIVNPACGGGS